MGLPEVILVRSLVFVLNEYTLFCFCSLVDLKFQADSTNPSNLLGSRIFSLLYLGILSSGSGRKAKSNSSFILVYVTFVLSLCICKWNAEMLYVCIMSWVSSSLKIFSEFLKENYCLNTKRFFFYFNRVIKSKLSQSLFTEISSGRPISQCFVASLGFEVDRMWITAFQSCHL